jgi:hypothetical protein
MFERGGSVGVEMIDWRSLTAFKKLVWHLLVVFESPVAWTAKRLQLNWTATNCNWTSGCSPSGLLPVMVAVAPNLMG